MMHSPVEDFIIAAQIDAHYAELAEEWETMRRVDERVAKTVEEKERVKDDSKQVITALIVAGVSPAQVREMERRLDYHQEAVFEALKENSEALEQSEQRIEDMLGDAYVLEDGRRVFKSEDGVRVFDEHGQLLSAEAIDADLIEDWRPTHEVFSTERQRFVELNEQRQELIIYQNRLDQAQEQMASGNMTESDFDDLNQLLGDAPQAVREHLPSDDPSALSELSVDSARPDAAGGFVPDLTATKLFN
ncbi:MAG: hypothetical protein AAFQ58_08280 [Pseudomonadota bacterium]